MVADLQDALPQAAPAGDRGGFEGWLQDIGARVTGAVDGIGETVDALEHRFRPTRAERDAAQRVHDMLAADKLGGADLSFNQSDVEAIADALLHDPVVRDQIRARIRQEAFRRADESFFLIRPFGRGHADRRTTRGTLAWCLFRCEDRAEGEAVARERIRGELLAGAEHLGDPGAARSGPGHGPRQLTEAELGAFQHATATVIAYADRVAGELTLQNPNPEGLTQAFMAEVLVLMPPVRDD